jgi:hypothetical protein
MSDQHNNEGEKASPNCVSRQRDVVRIKVQHAFTSFNF